MGIETEMLVSLLQGRALTYTGQFSAARASIEDALQLAQHYQRQHTPSNIAYFVAYNALTVLGWIDQQQDEYARARQHFDRGLRVCRESMSLRGEVLLLANMAVIDTLENNYQAACQRYEQAWQIARSIQYRWAEGLTQYELGMVVRVMGQYGRARELTERALTIFRDVGDTLRQVYAIGALGRLYALQGNYAQAQEWFDHALGLTQSLNVPEAAIERLESLALLAYQTADYQQALVYADQAQQIAQDFGSRLNQARSLLMIRHVRAKLDQLSEAATAYQQALKLFDAIGNQLSAAEAQAGLAWLALKQGESAAALAQVEDILTLFVDHPHVGLDEPFYTYLVCYSVLHAARDPRAGQVLHTAQQVLRSYADHIDDPALRQSFLENVAVHRELLYLDREP